MGTRALLFGVASGAALMYFFDPERGAARRNRMLDQLGAAKRSTERDLAQQARHRANQAEGASHAMEEMAQRAD